MVGVNPRFVVVTEEEILQKFSFLGCVVLCCLVNEFVYANTIIPLKSR